MDDFFIVPGKKSTFYAKKYLNAGNSKLKKQKYYEAIENYNKSLCMAEENSEDSSLAYASRSQVYFELTEYGKCLENIKQAVDCGYPKSELIDREKLCRKLIAKDFCAKEDLWSFFKLSHPPNPKVPFVANCLKMMNHEKFGRYIITKQPLKPGDIVAIEEPFFKIVANSASHLRCANCLKSEKMNLVPSNLCSASMFCSQACKYIANENFHQIEVKLRCMEFTMKILLETLKICEGNFDKLLELIEDPNLSSQTFFDFDWNDDESSEKHENCLKMHGLLAFNALQLGPLTDENSYVFTHPVLETFKTEREKEIAAAFMLRVSRILSVNCYSIDWLTPKKIDGENSFLESPHKMKIGSAILIFGSLFNHSCAPNIDRIVVENKFVFVVRRPVKEGEQLFISYGPSFIREPNESRQSNLKAHFDFDCSCEACLANYPIAFNNTSSKDRLEITESCIKSTEQWKKEFKNNCREIEENQRKFPSLSICKIIERNMYLLAAIAKNEPFVF